MRIRQPEWVQRCGLGAAWVREWVHAGVASRALWPSWRPESGCLHLENLLAAVGCLARSSRPPSSRPGPDADVTLPCSPRCPRRCCRGSSTRPCSRSVMRRPTCWPNNFPASRSPHAANVGGADLHSRRRLRRRRSLPRAEAGVSGSVGGGGGDHQGIGNQGIGVLKLDTVESNGRRVDVAAGWPCAPLCTDASRSAACELAVASSTVAAGAAVPSGMSGARGNRVATRGGVLGGVCGKSARAQSGHQDRFGTKVRVSMSVCAVGACIRSGSFGAVPRGPVHTY